MDKIFHLCEGYKQGAFSQADKGGFAPHRIRHSAQDAAAQRLTARAAGGTKRTMPGSSSLTRARIAWSTCFLRTWGGTHCASSCSTAHQIPGRMCTCLKQYPLSVSLPINVNLRTLPVSDGQTTVVEANLRNMTTQQILLESVKLSEDERFYTSEDIAAGGSAALSHAKRGQSSVIESIVSSGAHQRCAALSPGCSAQYAFKLRLRRAPISMQRGRQHCWRALAV